MKTENSINKVKMQKMMLNICQAKHSIRQNANKPIRPVTINF